MAWTTITNASVAVGAKPFATTIQALRDNPVAIAEGATGAPRVQGIALSSVYLGNVHFTAPTTTGILANLDNVKFLRFIMNAGNTSGASRTFGIAFSNDGGATFGANQGLFTTTGAGRSGYEYILDLETGQLDEASTNDTTTLTVPTNVNAVRFYASGTGCTLNILPFIVGGRV